MQNTVVKPRIPTYLTMSSSRSSNSSEEKENTKVPQPEKLELSFQNLDDGAKLLCFEAQQLCKIRKLLLTNDALKQIPEGFFSKLRSLRTLYVNSNKLEDLPNDFQELVSLKKLNLSQNRFLTIPSQVLGLKKLKVLDISGNQIRDIPRGVGKMTNLQRLVLTDNPISNQKLTFF